MTERSRLEDLRRRIQSDPASIAFAAGAEGYRRSGQFETGRLAEARRPFESAVPVAPGHFLTIHTLAEIGRRTPAGVSSRDSRALEGGPTAETRKAPLSLASSPLRHSQVQALESFLSAVRKGADR